ncbi:MAG: Fe-S cluster assembly ATPase SufC [Ardenticatenia bacterium]|nr:MAG: Fe-S cluster assembly ATPase SufC [Ardenticatenia bacterium]
MTSELVIQDLYVQVESKLILKGLNLRIKQGEVHAIMGPNGSGKSTLAYSLMGHPKYQVVAGDILFKGQSLLGLSPDERARMGLFLAFQYPVAIPGLTLANFLRTAVDAVKGGQRNGNGKATMPVTEFRRLLNEKMELLQMDRSFAQRYLNEGFSGGEKKRAEILQMAMLEPEIAILDETDSGLDIDALRVVAQGVNALAGPHMGIVVITHYQRILNYIKPQFVHVLAHGQIVASGGPELALQLEAEGYDRYVKNANGA